MKVQSEMWKMLTQLAAAYFSLKLAGAALPIVPTIVRRVNERWRSGGIVHGSRILSGGACHLLPVEKKPADTWWLLNQLLRCRDKLRHKSGTT